MGINPAESPEDIAAVRELWREYYSFDLTTSAESRKNWIEPDVKV